jgi:hypothetical protein
MSSRAVRTSFLAACRKPSQRRVWARLHEQEIDTDAVEEKGEIVVFHELALRERTVAGVEELELEEMADLLKAGMTRGLIKGDEMTEDGLDPVELLDVVLAV